MLFFVWNATNFAYSIRTNLEEFAKGALDENIKAFVIHISSLSLRLKIIIHLAKKVSVLAKYSDFANVFSEKSANILLE